MSSLINKGSCSQPTFTSQPDVFHQHYKEALEYVKTTCPPISMLEMTKELEQKLQHTCKQPRAGNGRPVNGSIFCWPSCDDGPNWLTTVHICSGDDGSTANNMEKYVYIYIYIIAWWFCTLRWLNPQTNTRASEVLHVRITQSPEKMGFWKQYYIVVVLGLLSIASAQGWFAGFLPSGSFIRWVEISFTIFWLWMLYGFWAAEI